MGSIHYKAIVISTVTVLFVGACTVEPTEQVVLTTPIDQVEEVDQVLESEVRKHEFVRMDEASAKLQQLRGRKNFYTAMLAASQIANLRAPSEPINRENYAHFSDNPLHCHSGQTP
jgi:hypothetical protein